MSLSGYTRTLGRVAVACVAFLTPEARAQAAPERDLREQVLSIGTVRSARWPLTVLGRDSIANQDVMKWAEAVARGTERVVGLDLPPHGWAVKVVVRVARAEDGDGASPFGAPLSSDGPQRLVIDYATADVEASREALCRLLLGAYVGERATATDAAGSAGAPPLAAPVPCWLYRGVAGSFSAARRARHAELAFALWQAGGQTPLSVVLAGQPDAPSPSLQAPPPSEPPAAAVGPCAPDASEAALLVSWLMSQPGKTALFDDLFRCLARGEAIAIPWWVARMPGCTSPADLDEAWDAWMLHQRRIIRAPWQAAAMGLDLLEAELLLYPEEYGSHVPQKRFVRLTFRSLIDLANEDWMSAFCDAKIRKLRILASGRGPEFAAATDAYCRFLSDLRKGKSPKRLRSRLEAADRALEALSSRARRPGGPVWLGSPE